MAANSSNYGKLNDLMKKKEEVQCALDEKYERWEYLNEIAEAIQEYKANN
nr:ABC transporter C-terminal domain-containing protein [uncultured Clostridium sp.]